MLPNTTPISFRRKELQLSTLETLRSDHGNGNGNENVKKELGLERFSFECRKVIGFAFTTLGDWLKRFAPLFHPIRSKTKTNCNALACIFPRFASATCNYFEF